MTDMALQQKTENKNFLTIITPTEFAERTIWQGYPLPLQSGLVCIYRSIETELGITESDMRQGTREMVYVHARNIFYVLLHVFYNLRPTDAGKIWGKSHCNYLHAIKTHNQDIVKVKEDEYRNKYLAVFTRFVKEAVFPEQMNSAAVAKNNALFIESLQLKLPKGNKSPLLQTPEVIKTVYVRGQGTVTLEMIEQRLRTQGAQQGDLEKVLQSFKGKGIKFTELEVSLACNDLGVRYIQ
ncbi:MAG: hypothetical protein KA028_01780 [Candidatus Pacebacteria bacterium]|nr:hypothetical protein [Candidatus Paceibacterota bacterium]